MTGMHELDRCGTVHAKLPVNRSDDICGFVCREQIEPVIDCGTEVVLIWKSESNREFGSNVQSGWADVSEADEVKRRVKVISSGGEAKADVWCCAASLRS